MTKEEIEAVHESASQPLQNSWRQWVALLSSKGVRAEALLEYKPSITVICEPMMGYTRVAGGVETAVYISRQRAIVLFQECLDVVRTFGQLNDLLRLASYRCQIGLVDFTDIPEIDDEFYVLVRHHFEKMSSRQVKRIEDRMPLGSRIRFAVEILRRKKERSVLKDAA